MNEKDDLTLIRESQNGTAKAFEELLGRYKTVVYNVAYRMVNNQGDAEDITQSVFLKIIERLDDYNPRFKFFSWLYKITINESLNHLQARKHHDHLHEEIQSHQLQPDDHSDRVIVSAVIQKALMNLTNEYRTVIILRHFEELSYEEMSTALGIPEKTVKSRLFTAREQLRELLEHVLPLER